MAAVFDEAVADIVTPIADRLGIVQRIVVGGDQGRRLDAWKDDLSAQMPVPFPEPNDLVTLQYTGGTTGLPKGVNITHGQLSVNISQREAVWPTRTDNEIVLCVMPLFHVFASAMCLHFAVYCRGKLVILPRYHPELVLKTIAQEKITRLPLGPTIFHGLMAHEKIATADFSSLQSAYSGSAPLPENTLRQWERITGCPIYEGYGQSEAGPVLTGIEEGKPVIAGSVGLPLPQTDIQIVDVETGNTVLEVGQQGKIRARGPQIMSGYRGRPKETAETLRGGWLYTGDIGELDADGILYIRDRKKDMAIVGGYNVYPREIDEVLYSHEDVVEAAAIGVPDDYRGEVIAAFVVLQESSTITADALIDYCEELLAKYKVPSRIHLVEQIPKTLVGKIDKEALRERTAVNNLKN